MKRFFVKIKDKTVGAAKAFGAFFRHWLERCPALTLFGVALVLNYALECLSRRSLFEIFSVLVHDPATVLLNIAVIMLTLSVSMLLRQKTVMIGVVSVLWLAFGIANFIVLSYRASPLTAIDLVLIRSVFSVLYIYFRPIELVLLALGILAVIVLLVWLWKKVPRVKVRPMRAIAAILCALVPFAGLAPVVKADDTEVNFSNMHASYGENGFAYSFCATFFDKGIEEPEGYDESTLSALYWTLEDSEDEMPPEVMPNIIFVQLETYFDPSRLVGVEYSEDPVPVFTALKEKYPHGMLTVPVLGAGTANTEFEVLCSISTSLFGAGEYPYDTVMKETFCENSASVLKKYGYRATAIHNNAAGFYDRDEIFDNMGFDDFLSLEDMPNAVRNPLGWAEDAVLTESTLQALDATEERDFVYVISVQPHGKYLDEEKMGTDGRIRAYNIPDPEEQVGFEYYLDQLYQTDAFVGALIEELESREEPTVCVFYGDHLPSFNWTDEDLDLGTLYDTEYVIWSNYGLEAEAPDLASYELSSHIFNALGLDSGTAARLYELYGESESYLEHMELIAYDKLYGESAQPAKNARRQAK
ncbi:MAG: sulfatase-like hydrolase/transferase [Clostridia bacterium]|nr:sulfatase-like hydrolase/transferase [Clostridia bacterium]